MNLKIIVSANLIAALLLIPQILIADSTMKEQYTPGLLQGKLQNCPDKPNCINTENQQDESHYLPPLHFPESEKGTIMSLAKDIIQNMGGIVTKATTKIGAKTSIESNVKEESHYLSATFTSSLFRFVDDFELRQDNTTLTLHIRSSSRTGYSDFGVNKRRVNKFSEQFKLKTNTLKTDTLKNE